MSILGKKQNKSRLAMNVLVPLTVFSLFGSLTAALPGCSSDPRKGSAELVFWSPFDDSDVYKPLIDQFRKEYPKVKISYFKKPTVDYENDLIDALAAGRGPDIFAINNTWLAEHGDKIMPMKTSSSVEEEVMTVKEFRDTFVDVAAQDFILAPQDAQGNVYPEQIFGIPLFVDTLALFWNKDIFNSEGVTSPPKNWHEFGTLVEQLTKKDESGNILRAGAAFGTSGNVNRSSDILELIMMQHGTEMVNLKNWEARFNKSVAAAGKSYEAGLASLQFYTDFANPNKKSYTWNNNMDYSIDAFAQGKAAMMINYSYHIETIRAKQPYLKFAVAPVPQPKDAAVRVNFPNYRGLTVSSSASEDNAKYAWIFLKWLSQKEPAAAYLEKTSRPASRRDLVQEQKDDPWLGVFAEQALSARSWYQVDEVAIYEIFGDMIDAVVNGTKTAQQALSQAASEVTVLMQKSR